VGLAKLDAKLDAAYFSAAVNAVEEEAAPGLVPGVTARLTQSKLSYVRYTRIGDERIITNSTFQS